MLGILNPKIVIPAAIIATLPSIASAKQEINPEVLDHVKRISEQNNSYNSEFNSIDREFLFSLWSPEFDSLGGSGGTVTAQDVERTTKLIEIYTDFNINDLDIQRRLTFGFLTDYANNPENVVRDSLFHEMRNDVVVGWGYKPNGKECFPEGLVRKDNGHIQIFNYDDLKDPRKIQLSIPYRDIAKGLKGKPEIKVIGNFVFLSFEKVVDNFIFLPLEVIAGANFSGGLLKQGVLGFNFGSLNDLRFGAELGYPINGGSEVSTHQSDLETEGPYATRETIREAIERRVYGGTLNITYTHNGIRLGGGVGLSRRDKTTDVNTRVPLLYSDGRPVLDGNSEPIVGTSSESYSNTAYDGTAQILLGGNYKRVGLDLVVGVRGEHLEPYYGARARVKISPKRKTVSKTRRKI